MDVMNNGRIGRRAKIASLVRVLLKNAERGEETSFEFTVFVLPILMMIILIAMTTLVRSSQLPVWTAATACARAAIVTLDERIGRDQGTTAALNSLLSNNISASAAPDVVISVPKDWLRSKPLICTVTYNIDVSAIPGFSSMVPGGVVPVEATVELNIEGFKSKWDTTGP